MLLQIEQKRIEPDVVVVALAGKLALGRESQRLESLVDEWSAVGRLRVVLDLSGVDYIDSAGVGMVALAAGKLKESGGKLVMAAPEGRVRQIMRMTQMDAIIGLYPTAEEALRALGAKQPPPATA